MIFDCAILGGGPAGMNAALVLGRAKRTVALFDDNTPRNAVTQHSHGFLTRDGVRPAEFRAIGLQELTRYPSVTLHALRIETVKKQGALFALETAHGEIFEAHNILLATGVVETLPAIEGISDYYGKSLFNCPYCDGWEMRDKPLLIIAESEGAFHVAKVAYNWSHNLVVCTNGHHVLSQEQKSLLEKYGIGVVEEKIVALMGQAGQLERVVFEDHPALERSGGLVVPQLRQATTIGQDLGCQTNAQGGIVTDESGRTTVKGVYAAGDTVTTFMQAQLLLAAASGLKAAVAINTDLTTSFFDAQG